ncbi:MAG: polysaccharide biosynthesis/export family protein [Pyrinomonadaceae bacterium]
MTTTQFSKTSLRLRLIVGSAGVLTILAAFATAGAQMRNNPYSPSPDTKISDAKQIGKPAAPNVSLKASPVDPGSNDVAFVMLGTNSSHRGGSPSGLSQPSNLNIKANDSLSLSATDTYNIGIGDVLLIKIKSSPTGAGYFTVAKDGMIDYPLAQARVSVVNKRLEEVAESLSRSITLFPNAQVEVKVREYASHTVTVSGLVDLPGDKHLQREAIPLFVIRAEAGVQAAATKAIVKRSNPQKTDVLSLRDDKSGATLIFPGDSIEFTSDAVRTGAFYFIAGEIASPGQKEMIPGITLYQSIVAAGSTKGDAKKAILRRKNEKGQLTVTEFNIRSVRSGKAIDPVLLDGDIVEVRN